MLKVAIIGRPNVGKSTLFNRLAGKKFSIVHNEPGITRDWREADAKLFDLKFTAIDTAGVELGPKDSLKARMTGVTKNALEVADIAVFVVDARAGLTGDDSETAKILRKWGRRVVLLANKCDHDLPDGYDEFHKLGFGEPIAFSAEHGLGTRELYDAIKEDVEAAENDELVEEENGDMSLHLAIIGRPNAGKSTLVNALLGEDRMLTGPEAGLTRDAVAINWKYDGKPVRLVDTAGLRRPQKVHEDVEKMSVAESRRAIRLAHIVVLVVDATEMFESQDLHLAKLVEEEGRAMVIAINKWDLIPNKEEVTGHLRKFLDKNMAQLPGIPIVMTTATKGQKVDKLMEAVFEAHRIWNKRISTSQINKWLAPLLEHHPPPLVRGRRLKIRYITQAKARPPTFAVFANQELSEGYERYLKNNLREFFDMPGVPIRFQVKKGENPFEDRKKRD